ncbi:MAG: hypothetical protein A3I14_09720 [Candidatus Rokubacteria bacterium RIFCSPLOWO2_02_FULL_73_56]|nr:MAG: hypothetical protein A3D33_07765 [Candidatus Rokubacteria bacterium RIFCSPHIGHO2_02_FULL_73_26]OGL10364.1 MAG: hypothetical protein A3I14_09720 [Candidatus Rokubacteria bacterium RIFCSPLOWO2_02_FULL_73_56]OGL21697.1 MAG: hypothetical protein A3G44_16345 [Candidatus Rokubacteria bacterium RIFCSPLOWO2_12_FULL_73_47]
MSSAGSDAGLVLFSWRGCLFRVPEGVQPPKAGSLFFCRHLVVRPDERVLELGAGLGLAAVLLARAGARVVATDVVPAAVAAIRTNALLNGVEVDARVGDCWAPVAGERFDLICTNPPQMPTPPDRARADAAAAADNGGPDGWALLDRVIRGARDHLRPGGRLVFTIFAFLGRKAAFAKLEAAGLAPSIVAGETQGFPRLGYERLEHIRAVDAEATVPRDRVPASVERFVVQGTLPG